MLRLNHVFQRIDEAHGLLDAAADIELVAEDPVVRIEHLHIEETLLPVDRAKAEPNAVEGIDHVGGRELALVVEAAAVRVLVGDVPILTLGHQGGIRHRQLAILIEVAPAIPGRTEDAVHVGLRIGEGLVGVSIEVAHQAVPAVAIAVHLRRSIGLPIAVDELGHRPRRSPRVRRRSGPSHAHHTPVVLKAVVAKRIGVESQLTRTTRW